MLKKISVWDVGAFVLAVPVTIAAQVAAASTNSTDTATIAPGKGGFLHLDKLVVNRYVLEPEYRDGKDYVSITFTGDRSADMQITPDGMTPEDKRETGRVGNVLKPNGHNGIHHWAVL